MAFELALSEAEAAKAFRNEIRGVIANEDDRTTTVAVRDPDGIGDCVLGWQRGFHSVVVP
jgi:hypothetical protein